MTSNHTFGDSCMLKEESNTFTRRASSVAIDPPKITAQFFYCSALPIDDPLAAIPTPTGASATKSARVPPRPFSVLDNLALDQAWLKLKDNDNQPAYVTDKEQNNSRQKAAVRADGSPELYATSNPPQKAEHKGSTDQPTPAVAERSLLGERANAPDRIDFQHAVPEREIAAGHGEFSPSPETQAGQESISPKQTSSQPLDQVVPVSIEEIHRDEVGSSPPRPRRSRSFFRRKEEGKVSEDMSSNRSSMRKLSRGGQEAGEDANTLGRSPDTTGTPFLRVPARLRRSRSRSPNNEVQNAQIDGIGSPERDYRPKQSSPLGGNPRFSKTSPCESQGEDDSDSDLRSGKRHVSSGWHSEFRGGETSHVTVGISRLHVVEMPSLKMGPIYWDPVHDTSSVVRGTWFYKDTMWPVESDLANKIEEGYEYMKPWTPTYVDELNSCIEIGPEAEMKVVHKIWSEEPEVRITRPGTGTGKQYTREESGVQEAKIVASTAGNRAAGTLEGFEPPNTAPLFAKSSIIYADNGKDAQILRPNQLPSATTGRRPLGNIRKGKTVGIPIVRGFDMRAWEKINPLPNRAAPAPQVTPTGTSRTLKKQKSCLACESTQNKPTPTDLIMVIHGIGQKLSERVESFHFTHAINAFRRQINLELNEEMVKPWLRQDLGGIMVLPINWRSTLKLDNGRPQPDPNRKTSGSGKNHFTLQDITAESLPAVRNLISDVMLDIPYYLSHHKPKMIEAVITEANRVYRLWCINNPGFQDSGRVHLLAHSLGSVMALDILSKQPTKLPQRMEFSNKSSKIRNDVLEFDTKSLFFCGSPAGFFLLLNRAPLLPRQDRDKPEAEVEDANGGVTGQAGTFGCLAVNNLYNVMHYNDPVAYCLNACVDVDYAASLQPAYVPSASRSWGHYLGSYFRGTVATPTKAMTNLNELPRRPTTARLPTSVEMETHDFTREEIAEKRMFLLNDNGQIDYTLPSGGGPLEIQYINMLGAHSSYWTRKDFVRFLVVEVGRKQGKSETVNSIKAVKKAFGKK